MGAAGSCGNVNPDSAMIVAMNHVQYSSSLCGKTIEVTSKKTGKTVKATVQDLCPGCDKNALDLSVGLYSALGGTVDEGTFQVDWKVMS